ncbi:endo-polygalacturonase [Sarracenia purpurea var. burkii]
MVNASGVKISNVAYNDVHGSSATEIAVKFDCSKENPCTDLRMKDVFLTYGSRTAQVSCINAQGSVSGLINLPNCLWENS